MKFLSVSVLSACLSATAFAVPITGVIATSPNPFNLPPGQVADGSGLSLGQVPQSIHAIPTATNAWATYAVTPVLDFALPGTFQLAGMAVWNYNFTAAFGVRDVLVSSSTDGITYIPIPGAPVLFAQGPQQAPVASQQFSWTPVTASFVRFNILTNYGDSITSMSEVLFDAADAASGVPELSGQASGVPVVFLFFTLLTVTSVQRGRRTSAYGM